MTILPARTDEPALGIVIHPSPPSSRPTRFWAYLWTSVEEDADEVWHRMVPAARRGT